MYALKVDLNEQILGMSVAHVMKAMAMKAEETMEPTTNNDLTDGACTSTGDSCDDADAQQRCAQPLASYDGALDIELSNLPIPFHISYCFPGAASEKTCHGLAMHACRVATMSMDVVRGRIPSQNLERYLTGPCLRKLETMAYLLGNHMKTHPKLREELCYLPVIPSMANGMMVSPTTLEMVVGMKIGTTQYWSSMVFKVNGRRWVCTFSDIG